MAEGAWVVGTDYLQSVARARGTALVDPAPFEIAESLLPGCRRARAQGVGRSARHATALVRAHSRVSCGDAWRTTCQMTPNPCTTPGTRRARRSQGRCPARCPIPRQKPHSPRCGSRREAFSMHGGPPDPQRVRQYQISVLDNWTLKVIKPNLQYW